MFCLCYTGTDYFGEYRICGQHYAKSQLTRLHTILNANRAHGIIGYRLFCGKMDYRDSQTTNASLRPGTPFLFHIVDIPLREGHGLNNYTNIYFCEKQ